MIHQGSIVKFHFTLIVDGIVVDSTDPHEPLSYVHGAGMIIPGLEQELSEMQDGEKRHVTLPPARGYGERASDAYYKVPKGVFRNPEQLAVGSIVVGSSGGTRFQALIHEVDGDSVTLDLNHPLAGKTLDFDVEIVEVSPGEPPGGRA